MSKIAVIECSSKVVSLASFSTTKRNQIVLDFHEAIEIKNLIQDEYAWIGEVAMSIRKLLSLNKLKNAPYIILPSEVLHFKTLLVPKVRNSKQKTVTSSHIELTIPGIQNTYFNYLPLRSSNAELEVFAALIKKDWLNLFCKELDRQDIYPLSLETKAPLLINAAQKGHTSLQHSILFHLESNSILCLFIKDDSFWTRSIAFNGEFPVSKIEDAFTHFSSKNPEFKPKQIIFSGINPNVDKIINSIQKTFPLLQITASPLGEYPAFLAPSLGLALNKVYRFNRSFNLLPTKIQSGISLKLYKPYLAASFAMLMLSLVPCAYFIYSKKIDYVSEVQRLQSVLAPLQSNREQINSIINEVALLQKTLEDFESTSKVQTSWISFLNHLQKCFQNCEYAFIESLQVTQDQNTLSAEEELTSYPYLEDENLKSRILQLEGYFIPLSQDSSQQALDQVKVLLDQISVFENIEKVADVNIDASSIQKVKFKFKFRLNNYQENIGVI